MTCPNCGNRDLEKYRSRINPMMVSFRCRRCGWSRTYDEDAVADDEA